MPLEPRHASPPRTLPRPAMPPPVVPLASAPSVAVAEAASTNVAALPAWRPAFCPAHPSSCAAKRPLLLSSPVTSRSMSPLSHRLARHPRHHRFGDASPIARRRLPSFSFVAAAPFVHLTPLVPATPRPVGCRLLPAACTGNDAGAAASSSHPPPPPPPSGPDPAAPHTDVAQQPSFSVSRSFFGRLLVEVLSLLVGALLLLVVVAWRVSQVISLNVWRLLIWLSNVRNLGKWAFSRVLHLTRVAAPVSSLAQLARHFADFAAWLSRRAEQAPGSTAEAATDTVPLEEPITVPLEEPITVQPAGTPRPRTSAPQHEPTPAPLTTPRTGRRLILLRHAKTLWDRNAETPDHDRVLSARGKEEARVVGLQLAKLDWLPDVVLCSDAMRTVQTLSLLDMPDGEPADTTCTETLYYAVTGDEMAAAVDDALVGLAFANDMTLMVVCHNPGCEELVEQLTGHRPEMGTACAALLQFEGDKSSSVTRRPSTTFALSPLRKQWSLVQLIRPSSLLPTPSGQEFN